MKIIYLPLSIVIIFSLIGVILSGNIIHELSHKHDFKEINKTGEEICYLQLSESIASYSFSPIPGQNEKIVEIEKSTELKAYSLDFIILSAYLLSLLTVLRYIIKPQAGIEPATFALRKRRSNLLSY